MKDQPARRRAGMIPPFVIVVLGAVLVVGVRLYEGFDNAERFISTAAALALTALLLLAWFLFFDVHRWRTRLVLVAASVAALVCLAPLVRVEGVSGDMVPKLAWRWTPRQIETVPAPSNALRSGEADLRTTTDWDFPQFLGSRRRGVVHGVRLATDWERSLPRLLWRQPISAGWSSFAVVGDYAVTQQKHGEQEMVVCYELLTGRVCWSHSDAGRFSSVIAGDGPRATPTIAGGRVYTMSSLGRLNCLAGDTGELLWSHDVLGENDAPNLQWGYSGSPLVISELVVVAAGGSGGRSLVAYDKRTGSLVWQAGDDPAAYASPASAELAGVSQILVVNAESVAGHAQHDGRLLWREDWEGAQPKVPQPVAIPPDKVFVGAGYGLGCRLLQLSPRDDGRFSVKEVWSTRRLKPKFTNVVVRAGHVYGIDDGRALVCLDLSTGELRWRGGRYGHGQLLLVDDLLLVQTERGEIVLVAADEKEHRELASFQAIEGKTWNNPALSGSRLLVRNASEAACYELPLER